MAGKEDTIDDVVAEQIAADPLWSTLSTVADEQLYGLDATESAFGEEIERRIDRATEELRTAMHLRAAEYADVIVGESGHEFVLREGGDD